MKIEKCLLIKLLFVLSFHLSAQDKVIKNDIAEKRNIYIKYDTVQKEVRYLVDLNDADGFVKLDGSNTLALKKESVNVFLYWLNPLKYQVTFLDSAYKSPNTTAIEDYSSKYLSNIYSLDPASEGNKALGAVGSVKGVDPGTGVKTGFDLITEKTAFDSWELNIMFREILRENFKETDQELLTKLLKTLRDIDTKHKSNNVKEINDAFNTLKGIDDYSKVKPEIVDQNAVIKAIEDSFKDIKTNQSFFEKSEFKTSNESINFLIASSVNIYFQKVNAKIETDKLLVQKLKDIIKILETSISTTIDWKNLGYFYVNSVNVSSKQNVKSSIKITKYDIDSEKKLVKKEDLLKTQITYESYHLLNVKVSTGVFYTNALMTYYGVKQGDKDLIITEEKARTHTATTATFLNFLFPGKVLNPLVQVGADPTKKRPFLLFGGGVSIPDSRLAFSAGAIWTFQPVLKNGLEVGKPVESTSFLETNTTYTLNGIPKGIYIGIQVKF